MKVLVVWKSLQVLNIQGEQRITIEIRERNSAKFWKS